MSTLPSTSRDRIYNNLKMIKRKERFISSKPSQLLGRPVRIRDPISPSERSIGQCDKYASRRDHNPTSVDSKEANPICIPPPPIGTRGQRAEASSYTHHTPTIVSAPRAKRPVKHRRRSRDKYGKPCIEHEEAKAREIEQRLAANDHKLQDRVARWIEGGGVGGSGMPGDSAAPREQLERDRRALDMERVKREERVKKAYRYVVVYRC